MRVAIVSDYFPPVSPGGAELSALQLAHSLHPHVDVEVVTTDFGARPEMPFPVHYIPLAGIGRDGSAAEDPRRLFDGAVKPFSRTFHYMQFARRLASLAREREFDLIHTQQAGAEAAAYLSRPFHRLPRVTTARGYGRLAGRWVDDAAARHSVGGHIPVNGVFSRLRRRFARSAVASSAHMFTVSEFVRRAYVSTGVASESASSTVFNILPPVEPSDADIAQAKALTADLTGPVFLFAGRLTDGKGLSMLIDAMPYVLRQTPETTLVVAGGGQQGPYRARAAANLCSYGVRFTGYIGNGVVRALLMRASAVVMPSLHHEPLGRVLLEAVAAGVPAVATSYGGTPEVIEHGCNGLLVETVDAQHLAESLLAAIRDRGLAERTRQADIELKNGKLSPARSVEATLDVYEEAVAA